MASNQAVAQRNFPRIRLGDYIERSTANNRALEYGMELIQGVTNEGIFADPKGDPIEVDLTPYKIVKNGAFVYNPSRLNLGSIAYRTEGMCIVSHLYIVFYLNEEGKKRIDPTYLYMYFRRDEFYREVTFRNFGSQRPEFNFNDMSDLYIPLPEIDVQRKYVEIYKSMVANQEAYERGLDDLKLVIESQLERYKHEAEKIRIGDFTREIDIKNSDGKIKEVQGVNKDKVFMPTVASGEDLTKYKCVPPNHLACNFMHVGRDVALPIALNNGKSVLLVSPAYCVYSVDEDTVLAEYILMWLTRDEIERYAWFLCDSSVRSGLEKNRFLDIDIPFISKPEQGNLVKLHKALISRRKINDHLKKQIKDICPVLITGSLEEGNT